MMEKSAEVTEPKVAEDLLKGYTLKDRVVRSAKVKVLMPGGGEPAAGAGGEAPAGSGGTESAASNEDDSGQEPAN
jgi:hypothetical protein